MNVNLDNMARLATKAMVWAQADLEAQAAVERTTDPTFQAHDRPTTGFDLYGLHWIVQLQDPGDRLKVSTPVRPGVELSFPFRP